MSIISHTLSFASSEIEVVFERRSSFQHEAKARSLMLPPNFYEYEKLPPCPGCRGCRDSSDDDHHDDSTREEGSGLMCFLTEMLTQTK